MLRQSPEHLVRSLLEISIAQVEAQGTSANIFTLRKLAEAATVLGNQNIAARAVKILRAIPDSHFAHGLIRNFELPADFADRRRAIDSLDQLDKSIPVFSEDSLRQIIQNYVENDEKYALCLRGRTAQAIAMSEGFDLEFVGETLAILGDFDSALHVARDPRLESERQKGVLLVLVIETFRKRRFDLFEPLFADMEAAGIYADGGTILALGFAGREPWAGYPYPDY